MEVIYPIFQYIFYQSTFVLTFTSQVPKLPNNSCHSTNIYYRIFPLTNHLVLDGFLSGRGTSLSWLFSSSAEFMTCNCVLASSRLMALLLSHDGTSVKRKPILEGNFENACSLQRSKEWHIHFICI